MGRRSQIALVAVAAGLFFHACTRKEADRPRGSVAKADPVVDIAKDRVVADRGWALAVAKDPQPIADLARFEGWRSYFGGEVGEALAKFSEGGVPSELSARIGLARAALDLADAYHDLDLLVVALTPQVLSALETRPSAADAAPWAAFVAARLALTKDQDSAAALSKIPADSPAAAWGALLAPDAAGPAAALLRGEAAGLDATLPAGATKAFAERLNVAALARAGKVEEALRRLRRIRQRTPDFEIKSGDAVVTLRDPQALRGAAWAHAALAAKAVDGLPGWPKLLLARAQLAQGQAEKAAQTAGALADAPPAEPPAFAQLVLTDAHDAEDLAFVARAVQVRALRAAKKGPAAQAALQKIPADTIARRVLRLWAGAEPAEEPEFPRDRGLASKVVLDGLDALGDKAAGEADFASLALADRYVDAVQRRYGAGLFAADRKARAVKAFEAAEDKSAGLAPSPRNLVPALTATARMNVSISRPRVALKYLSRLDERLPAVAAPAEMLRDLLSLQAMENAGGATAGQ